MARFTASVDWLRLLLKIAKNLRRSSSGVRVSSASLRTRALKASQLSSRLMYRAGSSSAGDGTGEGMIAGTTTAGAGVGVGSGGLRKGIVASASGMSILHGSGVDYYSKIPNPQAARWQQTFSVALRQSRLVLILE